MTSNVRQVAIGSHTIFVDDDQPTFWDRVEAGRWEPGTLGVLERFLRPGSLFLDIGTWVGALTLYAASLGAEVVAVEADPKALEQLGRNLAANPHLAERVRVVPRAIAAAEGPVRLGARRKPGDSMSSVLLAGAGETWTRPGVTPGEIALGIPGHRRFDLVKVDIEGGEYALLPQLGPILDRAAALLLALHPDILQASGAELEPRNTLEILRGWNVERVGTTDLVPARLEDVVEAGPAEWLFTRADGLPPVEPS